MLKNIQHSLAALLRQSVYSRLEGYEDTNDAERLSVEPLFISKRLILKRFLCISVLLVLSFFVFGCSDALRSTMTASDIEQMKEKIEQTVEIGSFLDEAEDFMKEEGFACQMAQGKIPGHAMTEEYLSCSRIDQEGSRIKQWVVSFVIEQGRVKEILVGQGLIGGLKNK